MIPSKRVRTLLREVPCGVFLETCTTSNNSMSVVLLAKLPFEIVEFVARGVRLFLWCDLIESNGKPVPCLALTVEDNPDEPFYISRTLNRKDRPILQRLLNQRDGCIYVFDELGRLAVKAVLGPFLSSPKKGFFETQEPLNVDTSDVLRKIEDRFATDTDLCRQITLPVIERNNVFSVVTDIGFNLPTRGPERYSTWTHIGDVNFGAKLEERTAQALSCCFCRDEVFVSPTIALDGRRERELCDILVRSAYGLIFFETKAKDVSSALVQSTERRAANTLKQIIKGIRQLAGASKYALEQSPISLLVDEGRSQKVTVDKAYTHLAIVVSEIHHDLSMNTALWKQAVKIADQLGTAVHVFDPIELHRNLDICASAKHFFALLDQRWRAAQHYGSLVVKVKKP